MSEKKPDGLAHLLRRNALVPPPAKAGELAAILSRLGLSREQGSSGRKHWWLGGAGLAAAVGLVVVLSTRAPQISNNLPGGLAEVSKGTSVESALEDEEELWVNEGDEDEPETLEVGEEYLALLES